VHQMPPNRLHWAPPLALVHALLAPRSQLKVALGSQLEPVAQRRKLVQTLERLLEVRAILFVLFAVPLTLHPHLGAVGGLALLGIIAGLVFFFIRKNKRAQQAQNNNYNSNANNNGQPPFSQVPQSPIVTPYGAQSPGAKPYE
jgi:hypothetical protein